MKNKFTDNKDKYTLYIMPKLFGVYIALQSLWACALAAVCVLARKESWSAWGIGVIALFAVAEIGCIYVLIMARFRAVIDGSGIELRGFKGIYSKFAFDSIESVEENIYFNGLYKSRAVLIVLKTEIPCFKRSIVFKGKSILIETDDNKIRVLKRFIETEVWKS